MTIDVNIAVIGFAWTVFNAAIVAAMTWGVLKNKVADLEKAITLLNERLTLMEKDLETRIANMEKEISAIHRGYVSHEFMNRVLDDIRDLQKDIKKILALISRRTEDQG